MDENKSLKPINAWIFFGLTILYSWTLWGIAILMGQDYMSFPTIIFYALGGFGPSLIGLILIYLTYNKDQKHEFKARAFDVKRFGAKWYGIFLILIVIPIFVSMFVAALIWEDLSFMGEISTFSLSVLMPTYFAFLIIAVLAEEFGWRGFALDPLQDKYSALNASLQLGIVWSIWHFPLYLIKGTFQNSLGFGSISFFLYSLDIIPGAIIYTWIYNNTDRSILSVIIFHFLGNFISEMFEIQMRVQIIRFIISISIAASLLIVYGKDKLKKE